MTVDANGYSLSGVSVDGTELEASAYTLEGNTLTLKQEAIRALAAGGHPVVLVFAKSEETQSVGFNLAVVEYTGAVDRSELFRQISMAEDLQEDAYTADSWAAMETALLQAKELFGKADASQEEVDAAEAALKKAVEGLKPASGESIYKKKLRDLYEAWAGKDLSIYTKESAAVMEAALNAAKALLEDPNASDSALMTASNNLVKAQGGLEYAVQKLHLEIALQEAEALLALGNNYENTEDLEAAVEAGKKILLDNEATQKEVDSAANTILHEISRMAKTSDITSLERLIKEAKGLLEGAYTSSSLEKLEQGIKDAEAVVADQNRDDSAIGDAYAELIDAIMGLKKKGNKAALEAMLVKANEVLDNAGAYVAETIEGLADVTAEAQAVYDNDDALQVDIDAAVKDLTRKVAEARLLGDVNGDGRITTADSAAVLRSAAELGSLSELEALSADVNGDGAADTSDAARILQYAAEKITEF